MQAGSTVYLDECYLQIQFWQTVEGFLFLLIDSSDINLYVFKAAMPQQIGHHLNVRTIGKQLGTEAMPSRVPSYVFIDASDFSPIVKLP